MNKLLTAKCTVTVTVPTSLSLYKRREMLIKCLSSYLDVWLKITNSGKVIQNEELNRINLCRSVFLIKSTFLAERIVFNLIIALVVYN